MRRQVEHAHIRHVSQGHIFFSIAFTCRWEELEVTTFPAWRQVLNIACPNLHLNLYASLKSPYMCSRQPFSSRGSVTSLKEGFFLSEGMSAFWAVEGFCFWVVTDVVFDFYVYGYLLSSILVDFVFCWCYCGSAMVFGVALWTLHIRYCVVWFNKSLLLHV